MKKPALWFLAAVLMLCVASLAQDQDKKSKAAKSGGGAEQQIAQLEDQSRDAAIKGDSSFLEKHLANDYVRIRPDGTTEDRQAAIDAMKNGTAKYSSIDVSDRQIHVYGNAAVVTGKAAVKGTMNGNPVDGDYRISRTWVKQGSQWKIAAFHTSAIQKQ
jgi:ketosteroid isomerase-like protein